MLSRFLRASVQGPMRTNVSTMCQQLRYASSLVLVEHKNKAMTASTLNTITAAVKIGGPVTALVSGSNEEGVADVAAQVSKVNGINKVIIAQADSLAKGLPEVLAPILVDVQKSGDFTHLLAPHSAFGKNVFPRAAALLDVSQVSDIIAVESEDTFLRPIYAGNAIAKVKTNDAIKFITVRSTNFDAATSQDNVAATEEADVKEYEAPTKWVSEQLSQSDRPELGSAKVVIAGGRGLKNGENFELLYNLADKLGGAVGASRAAVDAGYVSNDLQIGQTGKIIAPELYVAVGISGAIQHLAGMKDSKTIVCINKDADAPIFHVSDYGLVADLFKAVPELTDKV